MGDWEDNMMSGPAASQAKLPSAGTGIEIAQRQMERELADLTLEQCLATGDDAICRESERKSLNKQRAIAAANGSIKGLAYNVTQTSNARQAELDADWGNVNRAVSAVSGFVGGIVLPATQSVQALATAQYVKGINKTNVEVANINGQYAVDVAKNTGPSTVVNNTNNTASTATGGSANASANQSQGQSQDQQQSQQQSQQQNQSNTFNPNIDIDVTNNPPCATCTPTE